MQFLALDIGMKRTGVAFGDTTPPGTIVALTTITHASKEELLEGVKKAMQGKNIERFAVGLPLLPGGEEGSQVEAVQEAADFLSEKLSLEVQFIDERYTTSPDPHCEDPDAMSACSIADMALSLLNKSS